MRGWVFTARFLCLVSRERARGEGGGLFTRKIEGVYPLKDVAALGDNTFPVV